MDKKIQLSIIVPIYNVEQYLRRCLDSILSQTLSDFELILIDDGSRDRCGEIIDEYEKADSRIVVVHQKNKGVSAARNAGLKIAHGKYIGFVDPDDMLNCHMFERVIQEMEHYSADLGIVEIFPFKNSTFNGIEYTTQNDVMGLSQEEVMEQLFEMPPSIFGACYNKVYRNDLIVEKFDESLKICEDNLFLVNYICHIHSAVWVKEPLYYVYERPGSTIRSNPKIFVDSLKVRKKICEIVQESACSGAYDHAFHNYFDNCVNVMLKQSKKTEERLMVRRRILSEIPEMLRNKKINLKQKLIYIYLSMAK